MGEFKATRVALAGAGESAGFITEQLAFEQGFVERRAIEPDEGLVPAFGQEMQACRYQLLAGAAFTDHQHWPVQRCGTGDPFQHLLEYGCGTQQSVIVLCLWTHRR